MAEIEFEKMCLVGQIGEIHYSLKGIRDTLDFLSEAMTQGTQTEEIMKYQTSLDLIINQVHVTFEQIDYVFHNLENILAENDKNGLKSE